MQLNRTIAGVAITAALSSAVLVGCSSGSSSDYDRVYDTRTHTYVVVTHEYYTHHRSYYSGQPQRHWTKVKPSKSVSVTKTTKTKSSSSSSKKSR